MADDVEAEAVMPVESSIISAESLRSARPSTDASVMIMTIIGIIGTLIISFGVYPLKNQSSPSLQYIYGIINQRGPVQYLELLMSLMVATMIFLKARVVRSNLQVIASNPIPADLDLNDDRALQEFRETLPKRPEFGWSILLNRVDRAIALWLGSKDVGRVSSWLATESSRDQSSSDSSYALSRVLMWAIPILGFIGTVQGLGQAVAGFGVLGGSAGVEAIKSAIGQVTKGLGVAFDTTLLALILTTFLMFPLTSFQRREENLFGEMDNYLDDVFLARLPSPEQQPIVIENLEDSIEAAFRRYIPDPDRYDEVFTRSIDKAASAVEERFGNLSKSYEITVKDLTEKLSANLTNVGASLENTLRAVVGDVLKQDEAMLAMRRQVGLDEAERFKGILTDIHTSSEKVAHQYRESAETIQATTQQSVQQTLGAAKDLAAKMADVSRMAAGIQDLLKINQAVEQSLADITKAEDFRKTLEDLRKHLNVTTDFCSRLSKPRVITLREE
jgi:biopolymer transport protein ExbB/TolQ